MTALAARVVRGLRAGRLAGPGDRVVVALSGGPDSVALALLLSEALPGVGAALVGVAHLHHGLRGVDADEDQAFCLEFARGLGVPCHVGRAEVGALARDRRVSLEVAGHDARYAFFEEVRAAQGATLVATGHTKNDLAETFLMRALRGAGLRGLGGIRARRDRVIRPLLDVSRAEILAFLRARGQPFREDRTNRDTRILRNRVRHDVLPWLERHAGPGVVEAMARAARLAADDDRWLEESATKAVTPLVLPDGRGRVLDGAVLATLPVALRRRVVLATLAQVSGRPPTAATVERILARLDGVTPGAMSVAGAQIDVSDGRLTIRAARAGGRGATGAPPAPPGEIPVPGQLALPDGGLVEAVVRPRQEANEVEKTGADRAVLDAARVRLPISVRFRWPGARLRPLGLGGRKKLQDVFVDRKVPREQRDRVPLVVDAEGRILWVVGHVVAHEVRVTSATTSVLLLEYRP